MQDLVFKKYNLRRLITVSGLSTAHYLENMENYSTPGHKHEAWELVFCKNGSVSAFQDGRRYELHGHQLLLNRPFSVHSLQTGPGSSDIFVVSFTCSCEYLKLLSVNVIDTDAMEEQILSLITSEIANAFTLNDGFLLLGEFHPGNRALFGAEQLIETHLEGLLISLLRKEVAPERRLLDYDSLNQALENRIPRQLKRYIKDHLAEKLTLDTLSGVLHYSKSYLEQQFKNSEGKSITDYIREERIHEAEHLLLSTDLTSAVIAEKTGFLTVQYFTKCFHDALGTTPKEYRSNHHQ